MALTDATRRQLQALMQEKNWIAFEAFFDTFMQENFVQSSIKRNSEFETIWQCAEMEGARRYLNNFKERMEEEAKLV